MPSNKNAYTRYQALDKCLRQCTTIYDIKTLRQKVSEAVGRSVSRSQIYADLNYMADELGVTIKKTRDGHRILYHYDSAETSIYQRALTTDEVAELRDVLGKLQCFEGHQRHTLIQQLIERHGKKLAPTSRNPLVYYEENPDLKGLDIWRELYRHITESHTLTILYRPFQGGEICWLLHPYCLKQWNERWWVIGHGVLQGKDKGIVNLGLDRIAAIEKADVPWKACTIDLEDYFYDVIGVTVPHDTETQTIRLRFAHHRLPYVLTKPLHPSQRQLRDAADVIEIRVKPNRELIQSILAFGNDVEVINPSFIREEIASNLRQALSQYENK